MTLWNRITEMFRSFMTGRYGSDQLTSTMVIVGFILYAISMLFGSSILSLLGLFLLLLSIFRMLSRDHARRSAENQWYLNQTGRIRTSVRQARNRFANRKEYKYFRCPQCHSWIRIPRHVGEVTVRCRNCGHSFSQKA